MSVVYSSCSTLGYGCYVYNDPKRTSPVANQYISDCGQYWHTNGSGMITTNAAACPVYYPKIAITSANSYLNLAPMGTNNITTWKTFNAGGGLFKNLCISYDGTYIIYSSVSGNTILFSNNGGQSFSNLNLTNLRPGDGYSQSIAGIAMSANGSTIAVLTNWAHTVLTNYPRHYLMISQDYGATWTQSIEEVNTQYFWGDPQGVAMSGDSYYILVLYSNGRVRINSQRGYAAGWSTRTFNSYTSQTVGIANFSKAAISFDGKYMLITCNANSSGYYGTYTSTNYGTNITCTTYGNSPGLVQNSVDMSYGGKYSIYTDSGGNAWFSNNYFSSASTVNLAPTLPLYYAAINHDGSLIAGNKTDGYIYRFDSNLNYVYPYVNTGVANTSCTGVEVAKGSDVPIVIEGNSTAGCASYGTLISDYCDGYDLHTVYADGACGTYETIQYNSTTCGYIEETGYPYYCDCGYGCTGSYDPCYYSSCIDCGYYQP